MSFESGADYLRRLKQDQGQPLTTASSNTPAVSTPPRRPVRANGDRARATSVRVEGSDVGTWGTFTDLSMHGCYIEMAATYPVGAVVNLVLGLNGLQVYVKGEVRSVIHFSELGSRSVMSRKRVQPVCGK
jgi:PilZ domain